MQKSLVSAFHCPPSISLARFGSIRLSSRAPAYRVSCWRRSGCCLEHQPGACAPFRPAAAVEIRRPARQDRFVCDTAGPICKNSSLFQYFFWQCSWNFAGYNYISTSNYEVVVRNGNVWCESAGLYGVDVTEYKRPLETIISLLEYLEKQPCEGLELRYASGKFNKCLSTLGW